MLVSGRGKSAKIHPTICPTVSNSNMQRCYENIWKMTAREQYIGDEILSNYMSVSKNRGFYPPKWMVKIMETPIKMDDLGVPLFLETPTWWLGKVS